MSDSEGELVPGPSTIEWTNATWNPVTGCSKVSPGCAHCYAETFAERWRGIPGHPYEQGFALKLWPQRLEQPLKWSRPRMIFVNSMSDLFHEDIPDAFRLSRCSGHSKDSTWPASIGSSPAASLVQSTGR
jgi:protein gp37